MTPLDWFLVLALNGPIIIYGLIRSRDTKTSADWFLAGRSLSWWVVGLSLYATAIDTSDLIADAGGTYVLGLSYFVANWVGVVVGWVLAAHFVVMPMYRAGMYTNAEYLEARFGPAARLLSAFVQVQYRTMVLGIIATTLYLVLAIVCDWGASAWWAVIAIAVLATIYTALGGLRSVAFTDALQTVVMLIASLVLFGLCWSNIGGWSGLEAALDQHEPGLADQMLRTGTDTVERTSVEGGSPGEIKGLLLLGGQYDQEEQEVVKRTPAWLVLPAFLIMGLAYSIVNHTQSMRMFAARSEWDLKMSVIVASVILIMTTFTNLMVGVIGRAMYPDPSLMPLEAALQARDSIYPLLVRDLTTFGLRGSRVGRSRGGDILHLRFHRVHALLAACPGRLRPLDRWRSRRPALPARRAVADACDYLRLVLVCAVPAARPRDALVLRRSGGGIRDPPAHAVPHGYLHPSAST